MASKQDENQEEKRKVFEESLKIQNEVREEIGKKIRIGQIIHETDEMRKFLNEPDTIKRLEKLGLKGMEKTDEIKARSDWEARMKMMSVGSNSKETYCDSDQSPLRGVEAQVL